MLHPSGLSHPPVCQQPDTHLEESHAALAVAVLAKDTRHDEKRGEGVLYVCEYVYVCVGGGMREPTVLAICC